MGLEASGGGGKGWSDFQKKSGMIASVAGFTGGTKPYVRGEDGVIGTVIAGEVTREAVISE